MMPTSLKTMTDLEEEMQFLHAKLRVIDQKKEALIDDEFEIRVEMQRIENQIYRLKQIRQAVK